MESFLEILHDELESYKPDLVRVEWCDQRIRLLLAYNVIESG